MDDDESGTCIPFNTIDYGDGCPPGSANPEDGCTLEGYIVLMMVVDIIPMEYAINVTHVQVWNQYPCE
jgi:hypothetical protein